MIEQFITSNAKLGELTKFKRGIHRVTSACKLLQDGRCPDPEKKCGKCRFAVGDHRLMQDLAASLNTHGFLLKEERQKDPERNCIFSTYSFDGGSEIKFSHEHGMVSLAVENQK